MGCKEQIKVLHIAVHLGGGVGKAIAGIVTKDDAVILLEYPKKSYWVKKAVGKRAVIFIAPPIETVVELMETADVVLINWWGHPLMAEFLAEFPKVPCRIVIWNHVNGCVYPYLTFDFLKEFDAVLFTSPYSYENTLWTDTERKIMKSRSDIVYGIGDFEPEMCRAKDTYEMQGNFIVGYAGTLNYAKLSLDFVKYCEAAAEQVRSVKFVLAGELSREVKRDIEQSRIAEQFEYVGYVDDMEDLYKKFDVFGYLLNGYNYATTENALIEAMAYGLPIIVLNQGVEKYIIKAGRNGYLADSPAEYAAILRDLSQSVELRIQAGKSARKYCCRSYSAKKNVKTYEAAINRCLRLRKKIHTFSALQNKTPYEWFMFFNQNGREFEKNTQAVFYQEEKGSAFQYYRYFKEDQQLKMICERLEGEKQ